MEERRMSIDTAIRNREIIYPDRRTLASRKQVVMNIIRNIQYQHNQMTQHMKELQQELKAIQELETLYSQIPDTLPEIQLPRHPDDAFDDV